VPVTVKGSEPNSSLSFFRVRGGYYHKVVNACTQLHSSNMDSLWSILIFNDLFSELQSRNID